MPQSVWSGGYVAAWDYGELAMISMLLKLVTLFDGLTIVKNNLQLINGTREQGVYLVTVILLWNISFILQIISQLLHDQPGPSQEPSSQPELLQDQPGPSQEPHSQTSLSPELSQEHILVRDSDVDTLNIAQVWVTFWAHVEKLECSDVIQNCLVIYWPLKSL